MAEIDEVIRDLKNQLQELEDLKTRVTEAQESVRETICQCVLLKEELKNG